VSNQDTLLRGIFNTRNVGKEGVNNAHCIQTRLCLSWIITLGESRDYLLIISRTSLLTYLVSKSHLDSFRANLNTLHCTPVLS